MIVVVLWLVSALALAATLAWADDRGHIERDGLPPIATQPLVVFVACLIVTIPLGVVAAVAWVAGRALK